MPHGFFLLRVQPLEKRIGGRHPAVVMTPAARAGGLPRAAVVRSHPGASRTTTGAGKLRRSLDCGPGACVEGSVCVGVKQHIHGAYQSRRWV
ncbi:hypothetical protein ARZXY2_2966 [Arthrobacter sp. ZXY-2]|nr:hypothetical protein ARZXY2_2966 [Arthrobacter sp. ZXY-2]